MAKTTKTAKNPRKKNRPLRFILTLIILLGAAGSAFYFGWMDYRLEAGELGVVHTKSHGWEDSVVVNGAFEWRWQALLPTNLTLYVFESEPQTVEVSRQGTLPSGDLYAAIAGEGADFDWSMRAKVIYRINPATLPSLASDGVGADEIANLFAEYESRLDGLIVRLIDEDTGETNPSALEERLENRLKALDDRFEIVDARILDWRYPDRELYDESRRLALDLLRGRQAVMAEVEEAALRREDIQGARIELLARYGEVLSAHPILLDLFAMEGNPGMSLLPIEDLQ